MANPIPGKYNRYADNRDIMRLLGVKRLPDAGMPERFVHGVRVYVKPIVRTPGRKSSAHRVMAICTCNRHVPVGRLHQHPCDPRQPQFLPPCPRYGTPLGDTVCACPYCTYMYRTSAPDAADLNPADLQAECPRNLRPGQPCACPDCN